jgi:hypothetical protein
MLAAMAAINAGTRAPPGATAPGEAEAVVGALRTLVVNSAYNLPCCVVAWRYFQCFELQQRRRGGLLSPEQQRQAT